MDIQFSRVVILSILGCGPRIPEGSWKPFLMGAGIHFPTYLCEFLHVFQPQTNGVDLEADMRIQLSSVTSDIRRLAKIKNNATLLTKLFSSWNI